MFSHLLALWFSSSIRTCSSCVPTFITGLFRYFLFPSEQLLGVYSYKIVTLIGSSFKKSEFTVLYLITFCIHLFIFNLLLFIYLKDFTYFFERERT